MAADFKIIPYSKGRVQLTSPDEELLKEAGVLFSYQKKVYGSWATDYDLSGTGIYSCFSPSYSFKVGLTLEVASILTKHGYKVIIDKELKQFGEAEFLIWNDPSSDNIYVKSTA